MFLTYDICMFSCSHADYHNEKSGPIENAALYQQARSFSESISKGDVQVKHGEEDTIKATDGSANIM